MPRCDGRRPSLSSSNLGFLLFSPFVAGTVVKQAASQCKTAARVDTGTFHSHRECEKKAGHRPRDVVSPNKAPGSVPQIWRVFQGMTGFAGGPLVELGWIELVLCFVLVGIGGNKWDARGRLICGVASSSIEFGKTEPDCRIVHAPRSQKPGSGRWPPACQFRRSLVDRTHTALNSFPACLGDQGLASFLEECMRYP